MALANMTLPLCDTCGALMLPKRTLPDGSPNPAFDDPTKQKRCGTCKSPLWNSKGIQEPVEVQKFRKNRSKAK